jgi:hypothetical protein
VKSISKTIGYCTPHRLQALNFNTSAMAGEQEFSLRPLLPSLSAVDNGPVALEGSFRIQMKKEDMKAKGVSNGDRILLSCKSDVDTRSGVGIAWLSSDAPSKNQGSAPFVKISHAQNGRCGFEYKNKCMISKFEGELKRIDTVHIVDINAGKIDNDATCELKSWAAIGLGK